MGSTPIKGAYNASRVAAIIGLSPYQTPFQVFQNMMEEKTPGWNKEHHYALPEFHESAPLRWGLAFESAMLSLAGEQFNNKITDVEESYIKEIENIKFSCHIDGRINPTTLLENKTTWSRAFYSVKGEDCNDETGEIDFKRRWGEPGTDEVPQEYQVQAAVQMLCSDAESVNLAVLVFPRSTVELEELGWTIGNCSSITRPNAKFPDSFEILDRMVWTYTLFELGYYHNYILPRNKDLESAIIKCVLEFESKHVLPELPPKSKSYSDVRRMLTQPMGTIVASPEMVSKSAEYSEIVRQMGSSGPMTKRKGILKVEIMNWMIEQKKEDWSSPIDKIILVDPNGGEKLISFSSSGFRAKKAQ